MTARGIPLRRRRRLHVIAAGVLAFALHAWLSELYRRPEPAIHDEFSYLLAADTFASGRLTNETHPLWEHFESFHIIHVPSYQSKYPPGQGLVLALGQVLGGHARFGLWLSMAVAAAALCWMLQGFVAPRWAFASACLFLIHPKLAAWWGQTYWGGALAMSGGALVFGALQRIVRKGGGARAERAVVMGIGLFVLAITRPFEGLLATVPVLFLLARELVVATDRKHFATSVVLPLAAVLVPAFSWMGYYNLRVTGDPFQSPYAVWNATYQSDEAELRHPELERYHGSYELTVPQELLRLSAFYWMPGFWLLVPTLPWVLRRRDARMALGVFLAVSVTSVALTKGWPHYTAPVTCLFFLVLSRGLGRLAQARVAGFRLSWLVVILFLVQLYGMITLFSQRRPAAWFSNWQYARAGIERELEQAPGADLIVVRYTPQHDVHREWVYNRADIDASPVVWAREMTPEQNAQLIAYFSDRRWWLLHADATPPKLVPYPRLP